jgi:hypothetical protein
MKPEVVVDYMPPYPRPDTKPTIVVRYDEWFLRRSRRSGQFMSSENTGVQNGLFWDAYGDAFDSVEEATAAMTAAPAVPEGKPYLTFTIPLD